MFLERERDLSEEVCWDQEDLQDRVKWREGRFELTGRMRGRRAQHQQPGRAEVISQTPS